MSTKLLSKVDTGLEYAVGAVPATLPLVHAHDRVMARLRADGQHDTGASVVEWVLITAVLLAIVLAVGATLRQKLQDKTNNIDFTTPQ